MSAQNQLRIVPSLAKVNLVREFIKNDQKRVAQRVVIDFSSPNIAKPFHFGHLKSTILGNFLANIHSFYGNEVTKLNYVGDWGTQYGLLSLGLDEHADLLSNDGTTKRSLLEQLVDIYVVANNRGKEDSNFYRLARQRFELMDSTQDADQLSRWRQIREISLNELKQSYDRLGIDFDAFEYESDYATASRHLVDSMRSKGLVKKRPAANDDDNETSPGELLVTEVIKNDKVLEVPILKSDGTSLYLTRDIAAAINRQSKYKFDKMLYVVGADQERHFHCLREIVGRVTEEYWAKNLLHVKIGKVVGMSSRSGTFVLLSKIIDEATERYIETTISTPTSKVFQESDIQEVGKQLAISALFVYDMRNKRTRSYEFSWEQVMLPSNKSGLQLQGTYARLCSLREKSFNEKGIEAYKDLDEMDYSEKSLRNYTNDAKELIDCLNQFSNSLEAAHDAMDPYPLITYAFNLCRLTNRARRNEFLQVIKESDDKKSRSRLTLFDCARDQLETIIRMIGLVPLSKI